MSEKQTAASPVFVTTRWSVVAMAQQKSTEEATAALETLCRTYWYPLYAYVRRSGRGGHDAQDLTQEFFAHLLEKDWLDAAVPERGRFRSFLLVAMKRFLAREWHREQAQKRGGGFILIPLDSTEAEQRYASEPCLGPDVLFDRRCALTLLEGAMQRLQMEFSELGKTMEFEVLKDWLVAGRGEIPYGVIAQKLGTSEGATRVAVHRLRKRFRALFREAVAATVVKPEEIEDECTAWQRLFGRRRNNERVFLNSWVMNAPNTARCPKCGTLLPPDAPNGV